MKQLTGADEMWFSLEAPKTPMHITDLHIYDPSTAPGGRVTHEDILNYIGQRLDKLHGREKRVPVPFGLDYSYWVEDEAFDLKNHVHFHTLSEPSDWRHLHDEAARIISKPLDMSRPLWEIHVIEGVNNMENFPEGCFAIVHKKHHGWFDGASATYLKSVLHTDDPKPEELAQPQLAPPEGVPSPYDLINRANWNNMIMKPLKRLGFLYQTLPTLNDAMEAVREELRKNEKAARTRFSGVIPSTRRIMEPKSFSMDTCQSFRAECAGATLNDIALTICSGALRKYFLHHNELPEGPMKAMIPVSVRKEEELTIGGNKLFNMLVNIHTEVDDPLERMAKIHEAADYAKRITDMIGARNMAEMLELAPLPAIDGSIKLSLGMRLADIIDGLYSGIAISNIPGTRVPIYFCGAKQLRMYNWSFLMDGMGMILSTGSYCNELVFTATSCPEFMPDNDFFGDCMQEAFDELCTSCRISDTYPIPAEAETTISKAPAKAKASVKTKTPAKAKASAAMKAKNSRKMETMK